MELSLYERLGGSEGIMRVALDIIALHLKNPVVAPRFEVADRDKLVRMAHEFMCVGCGGPEKYSGRDMREAHKGMNISEQEYIAVLDDILLALAKNGAGQKERDEVLAMLYTLKNDIVRV